MKFSVSRQALSDALSSASAIIKRTQIPALMAVKIAAETDGRISVSASNCEQWTKASVDATVSCPGCIGVPAELLLKCVKEAAAMVCELEAGETQLRVICGGGSSLIPLVPLDEFPEFKSAQQVAAVFDDGLLAGAINRVAYAVSDDVSRPTLNGICLDSERGKLVLVAVDGRRLAAERTDVDWSKPLIIPIGAVRQIAGLSGQTSLLVDAGLNLATFRGENSEVTTRLVEGKFPDWKQVIPAQTTNATATREELIAATRRAAVYQTETVCAMKLEFGNGIKVSLRSKLGEHSETISGTGPALEVNVQPRYLLEMLQAITDDEIKLGITDELSPIVMRQGNHTAILTVMRPN